MATMRAERSESPFEQTPDRVVDNNDLFLRWQKSGDQRARAQLVERFLPLARNLARRYAGAREPFDDLLQVASLALVKPIDRFDTNLGAAFASFAVPPNLVHLKRDYRYLVPPLHAP